jgi:hypothetical protein
MSSTHILSDEDVTFLHDVLKTKAFSIKEILIEDYAGNNVKLIMDLQEAAKHKLALDSIDLCIHRALAAHHNAKAHVLHEWIGRKRNVSN